jgi:integrase
MPEQRQRGKRGEGSTFQRGDGRWVSRVPVDTGLPGRKPRTSAYAATEHEAIREQHRTLGKLENNEHVATSSPTLHAWLKFWYDNHMMEFAGTPDEWSVNTQMMYTNIIENDLKDLHHVRINKLNADMLQTWANKYTANGTRRRVMVRSVKSVLKSALFLARKRGKVAQNVAELLTVPRAQSGQRDPDDDTVRVRILTVEEWNRVLDACANHVHGVVVLVAAVLGLRIGEACGLSWKNFDLAGRWLTVTQQIINPKRKGWGPARVARLKTKASRRKVRTPQFLVDLVLARRAQQREDRMRAGKEWNNPRDLAFTHAADGRLIRPAVVRVAFDQIQKDCEHDRINFHVLRHTAGSLLIAEGATLKEVQEFLGHASPATTQNIYWHLFEAQRAETGDRMGKLRNAGGSK